MGCASSSPVVNGEGGGMPNANTTEDMAERAKSATNDAVEAGEKALNGEWLCTCFAFSSPLRIKKREFGSNYKYTQLVTINNAAVEQE